jgi:parvulin-like peptidyl-prolyl isomerase
VTRRSLARWLVVPLALALPGCGDREALPGPDVAARIAGSDVRFGEIEEFVRLQTGESSGALESEALSRLLDQYLDENLLARLAVELGRATPEMRREVAVDALLAGERLPVPTEAEILARYEAERPRLERPERLVLRQIVAEDRPTAERARRALASGTAFEEVVRAMGESPNASASGEQGALGHDDLPAAFADLLFRLRPGEVSPVLEAEYGFLVFEVVERLPAATLSLDQAKPEIERALAGERADAALARLVAQARSRYAVEVYDRNLPFSYRGEYPVSRPYETR